MFRQKKTVRGNTVGDRPAAPRSEKEPHNQKHYIGAALVLALQLPADTFVNLMLPAMPERFGLSPAAVPVLLSVNRLMRVFGANHLAARLLQYDGTRLISGLCLLGSLVTLGYGVLHGFWAWLGLRLVWGVIFATLRLARIASAAGHAAHLGWSHGIAALGPLLTLLVARGGTPASLEFFGALAVLGLCALPAARYVQKTPYTHKFHLSMPFTVSRYDGLMFLMALMEAACVVLYVPLAVARGTALSTALSWGALFLGLRGLLAVFGAPLIGWCGQRVSPGLLCAAGMLVSLTTVGLVFVGGPPALVAVVFFCAVLVEVLTPLFAAGLPGLVRLGTARDLGAGVGAFASLLGP